MDITVYIAGPITDLPKLNIDEFRMVENILKAKNYKALVPHDFFEGIDTKDFTHDDYMKICKPHLLASDVVLFLEGWQKSRGASMEMAWALEHGKIVRHASKEFAEYRNSVFNQLSNKEFEITE